MNAVSDLFPQVVPLDIFMSRVIGQGRRYFLSTYHRSDQENTGYSAVEVFVSKKIYTSEKRYNYSQTATWSDEEYDGLNSTLGLGTYHVNFYMYGQESANMDHQYLTYVKLKYTKE